MSQRCADCLSQFRTEATRFVVLKPDPVKQPVYGFPCVSDPHDFFPDAECCSPKELAAHKRACETYGTPAHQPNKGCYGEYDEQGQLVKHVVRTSWGIGTNMVEGDRVVFGREAIVCGDCAGWYGDDAHEVVGADREAGE